MFETILEEYSMKMIDVEESSQEQPQHHPRTPENPGKERAPMWDLMDEPPFDNLLEEEALMPEDNHLELFRVKSSREEQ